MVTPSLFRKLTHSHPGRIEVDQAAAARFIKSAIASAQRPQNADSIDVDAVPTVNTSALPSASGSTSATPSVFVAPRITSKMKEREEYGQQIRQEDEDENAEEGEGLEVFDEEQKKSQSNNVELDVAEDGVEDTHSQNKKRKKKSEKSAEKKKTKRRKSKGGNEASTV